MKDFFRCWWPEIILVKFILFCFAVALMGLTVPAQISVSKSETGNVVQLSQLLVGDNGERIREISTGTISIDPPSIATVTRGAPTFTLTGAAAGDFVVMLPPSTLNDDLCFVGADVGANTVTVYLYNPTAGPIDDTAKTWRWLWFDTT